MFAKGIEGAPKVVMRRSVVRLKLQGFGVAGESPFVLAQGLDPQRNAGRAETLAVRAPGTHHRDSIRKSGCRLKS